MAIDVPLLQGSAPAKWLAFIGSQAVLAGLAGWLGNVLRERINRQEMQKIN